MKLSRNHLLGGLLTLLLLAATSSLVGQQPDPALPEPPLPDDSDDYAALAARPEIREQLGITDAQAKQLHTLGREALKQGIRNRADLAVKRIELEELLEADTPDRTAVDKKLREITDLQHALLKSRVDTRIAVAGILTPEQRSKLRRLVRQRLRAHRRGFGRRAERRHRFRMRERGFQRHGMGQRHRDEPKPEEPPPPPNR